MDQLCGMELNRIIELYMPEVEGYEECARKGRQCMDISFLQSQCVEKTLESHSEGACAQAGIKQFDCHIRPILVHTWLQNHGCSRQVSASFLRLQLGPSMQTYVQDVPFVLNSRSVGQFTGSSSVVAAGRIPLLDVALNLGHEWQASSFTFKGLRDVERKLGISSFVDNVYSYARQADTAIQILDLLGQFLRHEWM